MVLFGTTGTGRSATVKSILLGAESDITSGGGWNPITNTLQMVHTRFEGFGVSVLDTPGIHSNDEIDPMSAARETIIKASGPAYFPEGVDVVILVFSYNKRFSNDEMQTVQILNTLLPKGWLKSHGVILFTCGDNFWRDFLDEPNVDFLTWCKEQRGMLGKLFQECDFRCVLFDNLLDGYNRHLETQLRELIKMTKSLRKKNKEKRLGLMKSDNILISLLDNFRVKPVITLVGVVVGAFVLVYNSIFQ